MINQPLLAMTSTGREQAARLTAGRRRRTAVAVEATFKAVCCHD